MSALVVRGARLVEPDGGPSAPVDVTVRTGRVEGLAPATATAPAGADVLDADGRLLLPGFVDAHVHGEAAVLDDDVQLAMLRQGVTSVVVGQDGVSYAPSPRPDADGGPTASGLHDAAAWASGYFAAINGEHPTFRGGSVADLLATYDGTTRVNVGYLAPHGTIRYAVLGAAARPATPAETDRMLALLASALDDGALGLSTGLEYVPATYADEAELVALARVLAARGVPHVSHMRGYEDRPARRSRSSCAWRARPGSRRTSRTTTARPRSCWGTSTTRTPRAWTSRSTRTRTCAAARSCRWCRCRRGSPSRTSTRPSRRSPTRRCSSACTASTSRTWPTCGRA